MITKHHLTAALAISVLAAGCYAAAADATGSNGSNGSNGTSGADIGASGLPCDVAQVLANNCWSCHGTTPTKDAALSLATYDDLMKKKGSKTYAQVSLDEINAGSMPKGGGMSDADKAAFAKWVNGGAASGSCSDPSLTATDDPALNASPTCTSGSMSRVREGSTMKPGEACVACHDKDPEAPSLLIAGTVFPTGHEPNDCNSKVPSGTPAVQVLDANGKVVASLKVNTVGNFYSGSTSIPKGGKVQVVVGDKVRAMKDTPESGDCNSCHTQNGTNDAPGRIVSPL